MKKHSVGLLELETAVLECFLEKTPLSPLGINQHQEGTLASPNMQQTRKIKNKNVEPTPIISMLELANTKQPSVPT
jgi:hypothetical protein